MHRALMVDPDGGRFTYSWNAAERIEWLVNLWNERTTFVDDAAGRRTRKKLPNGTRASMTYDEADRLTALYNLKSDSSVISTFDYLYDKTDNRTRVVEANDDRVTWVYDDTYQLIAERRSGPNAYAHTFAYDPASNRTLKNEDGARTTYAYDPADQLLTAKAVAGTTTFGFDSNGNDYVAILNDGGRRTTLWSYENQPTLCLLPDESRVTIAYNADRYQTKTATVAGTTRLVNDGPRCLQELDATNSVAKTYTCMTTDFGQLLSQHDGATTSYFHFDGIASSRQLTRADETVSDSYTYSAYGAAVVTTGSTANAFRFVGMLQYRFLVETNAYHVRTRVYRPQLGQWTSADPLGFVDQPNLYAYVGNNPVNRVDPSGLGIFGCYGGATRIKRVYRKCPGFPHVLQALDQLQRCDQNLIINFWENVGPPSPVSQCPPVGAPRQHEGCVYTDCLVGAVVVHFANLRPPGATILVKPFFDWLPPAQAGPQLFNAPSPYKLNEDTCAPLVELLEMALAQLTASGQKPQQQTQQEAIDCVTKACKTLGWETDFDEWLRDR